MLEIRGFKYKRVLYTIVMSHITQDESGELDEEYTVDFTELVSTIINRFSQKDMGLEVINDKMQLRVIFSPQDMLVTEAEEVIKPITKSAIEEADTEQPYSVDLFEDEGDVIAVFAPNRN